MGGEARSVFVVAGRGEAQDDRHEAGSLGRRAALVADVGFMPSLSTPDQPAPIGTGVQPGYDSSGTSQCASRIVKRRRSSSL